MSFFPTNANQVQAFAGAMYGTQIGSVTMAQVNADIAAAGGLKNALNSYYAASFGSLPTASVAATVAANLGLTGDALASGTAYITAQLNGVSAGARGAVISDIVNLFSTLASDATFGAAATAWNTKVATAIAYTGANNVAIGSVVATSAVFTLTTGVDVADDISASRGNLTSTFKFSTGNETVNASVGTLDDGDILIDSSTADADVLNISGDTERATVSNIETINLSTATAAVLQLDNVSGAKNVNITGTNTVTVDGFNAATFQPTFGINNITRVVTIESLVLDGAASTANAETLNLSVSGLSFGTTTATQSGITLNGIAINDSTDVDGVYETVNLASTGTTANDFALTIDGGESIGTLNITGDQSVQIRADSAALSGVTVNGTSNTGTVTLRIDREGASGATNAANFTGVDDIVLVDRTAGTEGGVVASLKSGDKVTFGSTFTGAASSLSIQGATFSALADNINVTLDNVAAVAAGVSLSALDIQNVRTLNLTSAGHAASTSTSGANLLDDLTGDFTTINIVGDTSANIDLNINDTQTATTPTARTVVVNASGMTGTAFVNLDNIAANTRVGYTITGTANGDTVVLNNTAGTVNGGAGNDTITGGNGNDVVNGGDGVDLINVSFGTDSVTAGAGNDTIDVNATGANAVPQVTRSTDLDFVTGSTAWATGDIISITVNGQNYTSGKFDTANGALDAIDEVAAVVVTDFAATILAATGVTLTYDSTADTFVLTGRSDGTAFTASITTSDVSASPDVVTDVTATSGNTTGVAALDVNTTITDFAVGDIIDVAGLSLSGAYFEGASTGLGTSTNTTDYGVIVLTGASYVDVAAASAAVNSNSDATGGALVLFLNSTTGRAQAYVDDKLDTDAVAGGNNSVVFTFDNITTLTGIASTFSADSFII